MSATKNATEDVCQSAYRLLRQQPALSVEALNGQLEFYGYLRDSEPISERTFKHLHDLLAHGWLTYVPLNRWHYVVKP